MEELIALQAEILFEENVAKLRKRGYTRSAHGALYRELKRRCEIVARKRIANLH